MKLSLRFFYTIIALSYPDAVLKLEAKGMPAFSSHGIITDNMNPVGGVLYIDLLPEVEKPPAAGISAVTTRRREGLFDGCNLIVVPDGVSLADIAQLVANTFMRYLEWADSIYEAIAQNADLQTIVDLTATVINNPIYIADASFKMLADWGGVFGEINPTWRYQEKYRYLPYNVMLNLAESGELDRLRKRDGAWLVEHSAGFEALPYISKAIRKDGVFYGNFFIIGLYSRLNDCDIELADYLGTVLSTAFRGNLNYLETSALFHNHFLEDVIEGTLIDERILVDQLRILGWTLKGDYVVALFDTTQDSEGVRQHIMAMLTSKFVAQCLAYHGRSFAIINDYLIRKSQVLEYLRHLAKSYNRNVAVSERFIDFTDGSKFFRQADFALSQAGRRGMRGSLLMYDDVFLDHLDSVVGEAIPVFVPAVLLKEHDEKHNTEYCQTLLTWLANDRNIVRAAEKLYVHRNTLGNRLSRIEDITGVDLDDFDVRTRMQLSLYHLARVPAKNEP